MKRIFNRIKRSRGSLGLEKTDLYRFECFNVLDKEYISESDVDPPYTC
jgi:hypothetical protein